MDVVCALRRELLMRSSIKRLFSRWHLDNIKVVRRVIVSVVGATVVLIGIALLVCRAGVCGDPGGLAILPRNTRGHAGGSEKFVEWRATLSRVAKPRPFAISSHQPVVKTTNAQPTAGETRRIDKDALRTAHATDAPKTESTSRAEAV